MHQITLSKDENEVYQKILDFSRKALEQYIKNQERKMAEEHMHGGRVSREQLAVFFWAR